MAAERGRAYRPVLIFLLRRQIITQNQLLASLCSGLDNYTRGSFCSPVLGNR